MTTVESIAIRPIANGRDVPTPGEFRVYCAICSAWDECRGHVTLRRIKAKLGGQGGTIHWIHEVCFRLRALGWISFTDGAYATIRPLRRVELYPEALRRSAK